MIALMKRFSFLMLFCALFLLPALLRPAAEPVAAEDKEVSYAVAAASDVWFYSEADEAGGLFMLPKSYYVKIVETGEEFSKAEYGDGETMPRITGFVKNGTVTAVSFTPARPFLDKKVTLTYKLEGAAEDDFESLQKTFSYYGSTFRGTARYWYVCADGKFGYVAADGEPEYELNVDYLTGNVSGETPPPEQKHVPLTGVQIALVCIAVVAALAVAAFVFFSRKTPLVRREESDDFV